MLTSSGRGEAGAGHHVNVTITRTPGRIHWPREAACVTIHRVGNAIGCGQWGWAPGSLVQEGPGGVKRLTRHVGSGGEAVGGGGGGD